MRKDKKGGEEGGRERNERKRGERGGKRRGERKKGKREYEWNCRNGGWK